MRGLLGGLLCGLLLVGVVAPALAEDLYPPPWRGDPRSTYQRWEFGDANLNPLPDESLSPFTPLPAEVTPAGDWLDYWQSHNGVWPLSGEIVIPIHNFPEPLPEKRIWVQITWNPQPTFQDVLVEGWTDPGVLAGAEVVNTIDLGEQYPWTHTTFEIILQPNPEIEYIRIDGDIWIDEVVIDTICIPEPGTMALLGLGVFGLIRKRR